jgi:hypothetical protein
MGMLEYRESDRPNMLCRFARHSMNIEGKSNTMLALTYSDLNSCTGLWRLSPTRRTWR